MTGKSPSMMGESWLGEEMTSSLPPRRTSQAQPEPKRFKPASLNLALKSAIEPKADWMAAARGPEGSPLPPGFMMVQNMLWLECPPALLRTAVRMDSGTLEETARSRSSRERAARSGWSLRAAFRLLT